MSDKHSPTSRNLNRPEIGFWMIKLVRNGPEVPASIQWERTEYEPGNSENRMERSAILTARIAGEIVPWERVWHTKGRRITAQEYAYRVADHKWAREHAPEEPTANPDKPINLLTAKLPF